MIFSQILKLRKYTLFVKIQFWKKPATRTAGFSSRIPYSSLHIIPLDYDNIVDQKREDRKEERLIEELQFLQDQFQIGNFYVFDTGDGHSRHAVCIDALRLRDVKEVVDFSNCDLAFKKAPAINEYRCWILRYYTKGKRPSPKYIYTVTSEYEGQNPQSQPHAKYLENLFGLKLDLKNPIGDYELELQEYNTAEKPDTLNQKDEEQ